MHWAWTYPSLRGTFSEYCKLSRPGQCELTRHCEEHFQDIVSFQDPVSVDLNVIARNVLNDNVFDECLM